ncbi:MAG TPA: hypothetical protein VN036_00570 [Devosia sp.]|nr:hypothetical protein [Devosia sp.]
MKSRPYRLRGKPKPRPATERPLDGAARNARNHQVVVMDAAADHVADGVSARSRAGAKDEPAHE